MRQPLIRWPLTAILLWFSWLAGVQGLATMRSDVDWSDDYIRSTAIIIDSREIYTSQTWGGLWECRLIVEWEYQDKTYQNEPIWLHGGISSKPFPENCGSERYGESVPIWIAGTSAPDPYILEPGNRSAKPTTGIFNLLQMVLFLGVIGLLWKPRRKHITK